MNVEMLHVADAVAREKSVDREMVLEAMESALKTVARRTYGNKRVEAEIDRESGEIRLFHVRSVVEEVEDEENELDLTAGQAIDSAAEVGTEFRESLPPVELGRIAAQTAKQVINQKIREAERERIVAEYEPRVGELITGIVKRVERGNVTVDLGRGEGVIYREELLPRETFRQGDRVRAYLREVRNQPKGPLVFLSRADAGMVLRLFEQEVPEVQDGVVEIQAIARDPGSRSKIAVVSNDPSIDPVGACVGTRGARVQAVVNELHGEKIDIIEWTPDPATFVINAMAPAAIERVMVDEEQRTIETALAEDQLAIAIGRRGQNVRLASELSGWKIEIMTIGEERQKREHEVADAISTYVEALDVDEDMANLLASEGFISMNDMAYCSLEELTAIEGFDEELAAELQKRARDALLQKALAEKQAAAVDIDESLLNVPGVDADTATRLAEVGIGTAGALAEAAASDLSEIDGLSQKQVEDLIIAAREACGWFD
ncbi:MAG: transcription termination factor NusA [Mariprofundaceae bacterium]